MNQIQKYTPYPSSCCSQTSNSRCWPLYSCRNTPFDFSGKIRRTGHYPFIKVPFKRIIPSCPKPQRFNCLPINGSGTNETRFFSFRHTRGLRYRVGLFRQIGKTFRTRDISTQTTERKFVVMYVAMQNEWLPTAKSPDVVYPLIRARNRCLIDSENAKSPD